MKEQHKAVVKQVFEAINHRELDRLDHLTTDDYVWHGPGKDLVGVHAAKRNIAMYVEAFPDLELSIVELIAEEDRVVAKWRGEGTNTGELAGMPPTGNRSIVNGILICRFAEDGRIAEEWEVFEELQMLQQLGLAPSREVERV